jgi:hypothetical protein
MLAQRAGLPVALCCICILLLGSLGPAGGTPVDPANARDQNKLLRVGTYYFLRFDDTIVVNGKHNPGETLYASMNHGNAERQDLSCWMAVAHNILEYEPGLSGSYSLTGWLCNGINPDAVGARISDAPWSDEVGRSGWTRTFDDRGHIHWALKAGGATLDGPFWDSENHQWPFNPITWCQTRLNEGHPVGLGVWFPSSTSRLVGSGSARDTTDVGHAITLWAIDAVNHKLTITDSEDTWNDHCPAGPWVRDDVVYTYDDASKVWKIEDSLVLGDPWIDYIVAVTGPVAVERTSWGAIKALYR